MGGLDGVEVRPAPGRVQGFHGLCNRRGAGLVLTLLQLAGEQVNAVEGEQGRRGVHILQADVRVGEGHEAEIGREGGRSWASVPAGGYDEQGTTSTPVTSAPTQWASLSVQEPVPSSPAERA